MPESVDTSQANWAGSQLEKIWGKSLMDPFDPIVREPLNWLERSAKNDRKNNPAKAFTVLGGIAAIRNDPETMQRYFENAIRHTRWDPYIRLNDGMCLRRFGAFALAYKQNTFAVSIRDTEPMFLGGLILC